MRVTRTIALEGRTVSYSVRYSRRAKRLALRFTPASGLELVVPKRWHGPTADFDELLMFRSGWVLRRLDRAAHLAAKMPKPSFAHGSMLQLFGKNITLIIQQTNRKRSVAKFTGESLIIQTPNVEASCVRDIVVAWYKHAARRAIVERVEQLNFSVGFTFSRILIRDQRSRWASCSRRRTLSFNWRLLLVPSDVMDYLIYHELAHLEEMNHSRRFWRLVEELCPWFRDAERWLTENEAVMLW